MLVGNILYIVETATHTAYVLDNNMGTPVHVCILGCSGQVVAGATLSYIHHSRTLLSLLFLVWVGQLHMLLCLGMIRVTVWVCPCGTHNLCEGKCGDWFKLI